MNYAEASNEELARQVCGGDESAVAELVERCWPMLRTKFLRVAAPDEARGLARAVVVQAARSSGENGDHFLSKLSAETERPSQEKPPGEPRRNGAVTLQRTPEEQWAAWEATWEARSHWDENRAKFPMEMLIRYIGQHVAWSPDGARIVDADEDGEALWARLQEKGIDPSLLPFEYIPRL